MRANVWTRSPVYCSRSTMQLSASWGLCIRQIAVFGDTYDTDLSAYSSSHCL